MSAKTITTAAISLKGIAAKSVISEVISEVISRQTITAEDISAEIVVATRASGAEISRGPCVKRAQARAAIKGT